MTIPALQVDVDGWLITQLTASVQGVRFDSDRPGNTRFSRFVQVARIGGPNDNLILDQPTVSFACFTQGDAQEDANVLGYTVAAAVRALKGVPLAGAILTHYRTLSGPYRAVTVNPNIRHAALLMQLTIKTTSQ